VTLNTSLSSIIYHARTTTPQYRPGHEI